MAFKLKSFKELVSMTKEALDVALLPMKERTAKAKAEIIKIELETKMLELEQKINKACAQGEPNFNSIVDLMDEYALTERRLDQINQVVTQLFPASEN